MPPLDEMEQREFETLKLAVDRLQQQAHDHQVQADRMAMSLDDCKTSLTGIRDRVAAMSDRLATMDHRDHKMATDMSVVLESLEAQSGVINQLRAVLKDRMPRRGPRRKRHG